MGHMGILVAGTKKGDRVALDPISPRRGRAYSKPLRARNEKMTMMIPKKMA